MFPVYYVKDVTGLYPPITPPLRGESQKPSRQAKADAVGGKQRPVPHLQYIHTGSRLLPQGKATRL